MREEVLKVLANLKHKMSEDEYNAVLSFLFPEDFPPNEDVNKVIETIKEKGKKHFKVKREGNEIVIEILDEG